MAKAPKLNAVKFKLLDNVPAKEKRVFYISKKDAKFPKPSAFVGTLDDVVANFDYKKQVIHAAVEEEKKRDKAKAEIRLGFQEHDDQNQMIVD